MTYIDSGPVEASDKFRDVPKAKWLDLVGAKRSFLAVRINYDCRCLVEFCEEAELAWRELGYESAADMIRNGYELDPVEIDLAVAWLKHNEPEAEVSIGDVNDQIKQAREKPLAKHGEIGNGRSVAEAIEEAKGKPLLHPGERESTESRVDNINSTKGGTDTNYTLRRLARDAPEYLDRIEAGELSVNAAAIAAGIRKKPTPEDTCLKAFAKVTDRLDTLKRIVDTLQPHEWEWIVARRAER